MNEEMLIKKVKNELWENCKDLCAIETIDNGVHFIYNNYEVTITKKPLSK